MTGGLRDEIFRGEGFGEDADGTKISGRSLVLVIFSVSLQTGEGDQGVLSLI